MKFLFITLLVIISLGLRVAPTGDEHKNLDKLPDAKDGFICPSGHTEVKLISGSKAYPSRCGDLPKETEICSKCIYIFDRKHKFWERDSDNINGFAVKLTQIVAQLPIPKKELHTRKLTYSQYVKKGKARREYVVNRTKETFPVVLKRVKVYLKKNKIDLRSSVEEKTKFTINSKWQQYKLKVEVIKVEAFQDVYVSIEIQTDESVFENKL